MAMASCHQNLVISETWSVPTPNNNNNNNNEHEWTNREIGINLSRVGRLKTQGIVICALVCQVADCSQVNQALAKESAIIYCETTAAAVATDDDDDGKWMNGRKRKTSNKIRPNQNYFSTFNLIGGLSMHRRRRRRRLCQRWREMRCGEWEKLVPLRCMLAAFGWHALRTALIPYRLMQKLWQKNWLNLMDGAPALIIIVHSSWIHERTDKNRVMICIGYNSFRCAHLWRQRRRRALCSNGGGSRLNRCRLFPTRRWNLSIEWPDECKWKTVAIWCIGVRAPTVNAFAFHSMFWYVRFIFPPVFN